MAVYVLRPSLLLTSPDILDNVSWCDVKRTFVPSVLRRQTHAVNLRVVLLGILHLAAMCAHPPVFETM